MAESVEERLEKLERSRSKDVLRQERMAKLEALQKTPIKYVDDDPSRIHKSKKQIIEEARAKKEEELEVKNFLAEKKKKKEVPVGVQEEVKEEKKVIKPKSKGRPKRVE